LSRRVVSSGDTTEARRSSSPASGVTSGASFGGGEGDASGEGEPAAKEGKSARSFSTACRKLTPSSRIIQSITLPPVWQAPRQWQRFFSGAMTSEGALSA
jgi:hypothetical protein